MKKLLCIITIFLSHIHSLSAQTVAASENEGVLYRHEGSLGISLHSRGFGLTYHNGKHITGKSKRIFEIDLLTMKHPKEIKSLNQYYDKTRSFVYGKLNSLAILRGGIGLQRALYQKEDPGNVEVRYSFYGGASLGFAKPVYLYILEESNDPYSPNKVIEKYNPDKHPIDIIYGKAPLGYGLEKTIVHPGLYAKAGISFEWASDEEKLRCLEIGVVADYYLTSIQLMAYNKANPLFTTFYASLAFGRRWN
ncbi:MAG TPA: hypothetical protein PLI68_07045 [Bacteroidia bacterium]|nr:hypothetical protein [Bacteroidia bacterium]